MQIVKLALTVLYDGVIQRVGQDLRNIRIEYPSEFDLLTTSELADATRGFQRILIESGRLPMTEGLLLSRLLRLCMPGLADDMYLKCDQEIQEYLDTKVKKS